MYVCDAITALESVVAPVLGATKDTFLSLLHAPTTNALDKGD
jgi:hypothetical protein